MEDQNKVVVNETLKVIFDFGNVCRFCLSEVKCGVSINDKCLSEGSEELQQESVYNFMTNLRFIKMEEPDLFPAQMCRDCFQLIQLCYDFNQMCKKSERFLRDYHFSTKNEMKEILKTEVRLNVIDLDNQKGESQPSHWSTKSLGNVLKSFPNAQDETNKIKQSNLKEKLKESVYFLGVQKSKLNFLSRRVKKVESEFVNPLDENPKAEDNCKQPMYNCSECLLSFSSLGNLNLHIAAVHHRKRTLFKFQCKNCKKSFRDQDKLKKHYKVIHKMQEISEEYINNEVKQSENQKLFCFYCIPYKEFQFQKELMQHLESTHQNEQSENEHEQYTCAYCSNLTFPTRLAVNEHLLVAHNLKDKELTQTDVSVVRDQKPSQVFVCLNTTSSVTTSRCESQLTALLDVLNSVVDSLSVAQQGKGFKILCKNCNPPPEFTTANNFAQHIRTHHDESKLLENWVSKNGSWNCSECPATYSRKQTLCYHMRDKHKQSLGGMKCPEPGCEESFLSNRQLIQHGIGVHQKYFAYFHKVFKKILQPDPEEDGNLVKNFECDICQKKYIYKSSLRKHILTSHLGKSAKATAVCPYCGKTISNKLNLKSHIEFVHEALFVSCPICKKKINFRTIGKHYKTHKTSPDVISSKNSFLCNLCGKILKSKRSFDDHQKLHKNIRDELCDICGSGFTTKKFLRLHKKTHEGLQRKAFGCDQCDKVFSGRHTLNRHLLTHSGEKNFICEICSKCFYTLQELNRHVRYHKKEYRFDCQLCEMRFLDKSRFRHHMMRHRNVRPHKCQFCEKMFIVKGKMNLHMATKHNFEVQDTKGVWKDPKTYVPLDDLL